MRILNWLEKLGENHTKYSENSRNFREKLFVIFLVTFKSAVYYLLKVDQVFIQNTQNITKLLEKWKKYCKIQENLSVWKSGNRAINRRREWTLKAHSHRSKANVKAKNIKEQSEEIKEKFSNIKEICCFYFRFRWGVNVS